MPASWMLKGLGAKSWVCSDRGELLQAHAGVERAVDDGGEFDTLQRPLRLRIIHAAGSP